MSIPPSLPRKRNNSIFLKRNFLYRSQDLFLLSWVWRSSDTKSEKLWSSLSINMHSTLHKSLEWRHAIRKIKKSIANLHVKNLEEKLSDQQQTRTISSNGKEPSIFGRITRFDMAFSVTQAARRTSKPNTQHLAAVNRLLHYVEGTLNVPLVHRFLNGKLNSQGYWDALYGNSGAQGKLGTTTGTMFFFSERIASFFLSLQKNDPTSPPTRPPSQIVFNLSGLTFRAQYHLIRGNNKNINTWPSLLTHFSWLEVVYLKDEALSTPCGCVQDVIVPLGIRVYHLRSERGDKCIADSLRMYCENSRDPSGSHCTIYSTTKRTLQRATEGLSRTWLAVRGERLWLLLSSSSIFYRIGALALVRPPPPPLTRCDQLVCTQGPCVNRHHFHLRTTENDADPQMGPHPRLHTPKKNKYPFNHRLPFFV